MEAQLGVYLENIRDLVGLAIEAGRVTQRGGDFDWPEAELERNKNLIGDLLAAGYQAGVELELLEGNPTAAGAPRGILHPGGGL